MLKVTHRDLIDRALTEVDTLDVDDAVALLEDDDTIFVDLRDPRELEREGKVPNAFHAPRGMLEFWVDPSSPYHKEVFASGVGYQGSTGHGTRACLSHRRWLPGLERQRG